MRKFKFEQVNSTPYKGLDGSVIFHDGTDPAHHILVEAVNGLGVPNSVVQTQQAPFQVGASPIRVTYGPRTISLECAIIIDCKSAAGKASMETVKRDLGNIFSPVGMGYVPQTSLTGSAYLTVTGKLSFAPDGVTFDRFIDCVPISCEFADRGTGSFQRFRLALFCPDPTWYGVEQSSLMTSVDNAGSDVLNSIAYSPELGVFCSVGFQVAFVSKDGARWQATGISASYEWKNVVWCNHLEKFVAISPALGKVSTSVDGVNWTSPITVTLAQYNSTLEWSEELGLLVQCGYNGLSETLIFTSTDADTWTSRATADAGINIIPKGLAWSKELNIFVMTGTSGTKHQISSNGTSWSLVNASGNASCVLWSRRLQLFIAGGYGADIVQTSPDGTNWTQTIVTVGTPLAIAESESLGLIVLTGTSGSIYTSNNGTSWTARTGVGAFTNNAVAFGNGMFAVASYGAGGYPQVSYDGSNWVRATASDYLQEITNDGDVPAEFEIDIPVAGGETGKVIAIGDNFLWSGTGTPPSDHNLVFGTDGLKKGTVTVSTKFNNKDITQFGVSKFNLYQQGTFFSLYVSGATTNNIYVRNTGASAGAPTIRWKNRYLGV